MLRRSASALALLAVVASFAAAQAAPAAAPAAPPAAAKPTTAQTKAAIDTMRMEIAAARKQTVALNMNLTPDEATKFWPVYDAYRAEMKTARDGEWAMLHDYAQHYTMMTDSVAQRLMNGWMTSRKAQLDLRATYVPKFAEAVGWKKAARYFQIENKLDVMLDYARSKEIPLTK
jgi:Spy/CpxP family protein refolding chaperone